MILAGVSAIPDLSPLSSLVGMLSPDNGLICSYLDHGFRRNCLEILAETAAHFSQDLVQCGAVNVLRAQTFSSNDEHGASLAGDVLRKITCVS